MINWAYPLLYFALSLTNIQCVNRPSMTCGKIIYDIEVVLSEDAETPSEYSRELYQKILSSNSPSSRTVYFDGKSSTTQEVNSVYGFNGLVTTIRKAGSDKYTYCKEFPQLSFYMELEDEVEANGEFVPVQVSYSGKEKRILGFRCKEATLTDANSIYQIWYTDEITITDSTHAILHHDKIPGIILEQTELPSSGPTYFYRHYTATAFSSDPLPNGIFEIPDGYQQVSSIDEARTKNKALMEQKAKEELADSPLNEDEQKRFLGAWLITTQVDSILLHIVESDQHSMGMNNYSVLLYYLNSPDRPLPAASIQEARLMGRKLLVESPPNFDLYSLDSDSRTITLERNPIFKYRKLDADSWKEIMEKYQLL